MNFKNLFKTTLISVLVLGPATLCGMNNQQNWLAFKQVILENATVQRDTQRLLNSMLAEKTEAEVLHFIAQTFPSLLARLGTLNPQTCTLQNLRSIIPSGIWGPLLQNHTSCKDFSSLQQRATHAMLEMSRLSATVNLHQSSPPELATLNQQIEAAKQELRSAIHSMPHLNILQANSPEADLYKTVTRTFTFFETVISLRALPNVGILVIQHATHAQQSE